MRFRIFAAVLILALAAAAQQEPKRPDSEKKADTKKENIKPSDGQDALDTTVFSAAVANDVLGQLRDGLQGHNQRLMLSAFDSDKMDGYLRFEDQIQAMFDRYEEFRVYFRIAQTTIAGPRGIALVDVQLEQLPHGGNAPPVRKRTQMRFELERGRKGWKIVDFRPREFFS
jgi:hypothetical protein